MSDPSFFAQLRERRVIRAALIYVALLWAALQVADLLAGAGIISEQLVRWLILLGALGLPVTLVASWFLESPWRSRRWTSILGDVVIITGIALAAALFAWQQWFASFTRPTLAVLPIEATDTREDTAQLASHLAERLRMGLATRPELRVLELSSSRHPSLDGLSITSRAEHLGADLLVAGTVAQGGPQLRLTLQLYSADGSLLHGQTFEDSVTDQEQLQDRALSEFWPHLPLPDAGLADVRAVVASCKYPASSESIFAIAAAEAGGGAAILEPFLDTADDAGMLRLAMTRALFDARHEAAPVEQPVIQSMAMQQLASLEASCPQLPDAELLRLANTLTGRGDESHLLRHPSAALLYRQAAQANSEPRRAAAFLEEARLLDPLGDW